MASPRSSTLIGIRICFLATSFPRFPDDEASVFLQRLVEGYSTCGASGIVIVPQDKDEPSQSSCGRFAVRRYRYGLFVRGALAFGAGIMPNLRRHPLRIFQAPLLLLQQIRLAVSLRREWDVIHANWSISLLAGWMISRITGRPFIVTLRGEDMRLLRIPLLRSLLSVALRRASAVVSVNHLFISEIRDRARIPESRCFIIPNGVAYTQPRAEDLRAFLENKKLLETPYLLFVGSVIPRKRIELLIEALARPQLQNTTLVICGRLEDSHYVHSLEERAESLQVRNRVRFEGAVPPSRIPLYLDRCAAFVSASEFEGRPNAILEALAAGKFVLASDIPAHREIIRSGENGVLFSSAEQLAEEYATRVEDLAALARLQAQARATVAGQSWESCAREYLERVLACCQNEVTVK